MEHALAGVVMGHAAIGERTERGETQSLSTSLHGHSIGRWGGEEFLVLMAGDVAAAAALVKRAKAELGARHFKLRDTDELLGRITFSAGAVALLTDAADLAAALEGADALLYRAKAAGRDMVLAA